jgi:hypothetical protein
MFIEKSSIFTSSIWVRVEDEIGWKSSEIKRRKGICGWLILFIRLWSWELNSSRTVNFQGAVAPIDSLLNKHHTGRMLPATESDETLIEERGM